MRFVPAQGDHPFKGKDEAYGPDGSITKTGFINNDILKKFGYVVGANRIPALDAILILSVIAPLGLPDRARRLAVPHETQGATTSA